MEAIKAYHRTRGGCHGIVVISFLLVFVVLPQADSGVVSLFKAKKLAKVALIGAAIAPRLVIPLPSLNLPHLHHTLPHTHQTSHIHHDWSVWPDWDWPSFDHHEHHDHHHHHHFHEIFHTTAHHKIHVPAETFEVIETPADEWH